MTQEEMLNKMWSSDRQEWTNRINSCKNCTGRECKSPFFGYQLEMYYSRDSERTKIFNVPCKYRDRITDVNNPSIHDRWKNRYNSTDSYKR